MSILQRWLGILGVIIYSALIVPIFLLLDRLLNGHRHPGDHWERVVEMLYGLGFRDGHGIPAWLTFLGIPLLVYGIVTAIVAVLKKRRIA